MTPKRNRWGVPTDGHGDIDNDWIDSLHQRLFAHLEQDIAVLDSIGTAKPDPVEQLRNKINLLEQMLKVRRLMREVWPKRLKPRCRRRRNGR
jgi:hypothetical protein